MDIYDLCKILSKLKYKDFSSCKIKNINYNSREDILIIKHDNDFSIEIDIKGNTIKRVLDLKEVDVIKIL